MTRHFSYYILHDKQLVVETDFAKWLAWFGTTARQVAETRIGGVWVSTIFLGLDHCLHGDGPPLVFETMVFRGGEGCEMFRCSTWNEAEEMHADAVAAVRAEIKDKVNQ